MWVAAPGSHNGGDAGEVGECAGVRVPADRAGALQHQRHADHRAHRRVRRAHRQLQVATCERVGAGLRRLVTCHGLLQGCLGHGTELGTDLARPSL